MANIWLWSFKPGLILTCYIYALLELRGASFAESSPGVREQQETPRLFLSVYSAKALNSFMDILDGGFY